uniref:Peptidoglycan binding-like domain-containing protein n=1 Tax=Salix viminalis TaxID=40686 RepID=A0A6N2MLD8_SALVM
MAPKLSHLLLAILVIFSIQTFKGRARTLKPEHQQSFGSFLQKLEGVQKGQAAEGLLDLKKYLKKFGYYPSDATLTSSDFDDHLELALKAYQKFYRLNVTGNLDSSTTQQMMIPRCGVPDIINPPPSTEPTGRFAQMLFKNGRRLLHSLSRRRLTVHQQILLLRSTAAIMATGHLLTGLGKYWLMLFFHKTAVSITMQTRTGALTPQWIKLIWNPFLFMK